jgi:hypothetical protein
MFAFDKSLTMKKKMMKIKTAVPARETKMTTRTTTMAIPNKPTGSFASGQNATDGASFCLS